MLPREWWSYTFHQRGRVLNSLFTTTPRNGPYHLWLFLFISVSHIHFILFYFISYYFLFYYLFFFFVHRSRCAVASNGLFLHRRWCARELLITRCRCERVTVSIKPAPLVGGVPTNPTLTLTNPFTRCSRHFISRLPTRLYLFSTLAFSHLRYSHTRPTARRRFPARKQLLYTICILPCHS